MTGKIMESRIGEFATSKGHVMPEDVDYIEALNRRRVPPHSIAKMSGFGIEAVRRVLADLLRVQNASALKALPISRDFIWVTPIPSGRQIVMEVASLYGVTFSAIAGQSRKHDIVVARQHAMWELRDKTPLSLPQIGRLLGGRDHTTIIHGIRAHEARMAAERDEVAA